MTNARATGTASILGRRTRASFPRAFRRILSLHDFEAAASRKLPRMPFGYTASGAEDEDCVRRSSADHGDYVLVPRFMAAKAKVSTSTTLPGESWDKPFGIAPMGICAVNAYRGDIAQRRGWSNAPI